MGNCTGSPAEFSKKKQAEEQMDSKNTGTLDSGATESKETKPVPIRKSLQGLGKDQPAQRISADCKRTSASTDLSRGSFEDMYKMSMHPNVNKNEGLSKSGPDDMSTMYMSHMDRVLELPKDSSKAFRL